MEHSPGTLSSGPLEGPHLLHTVVLGAAFISNLGCAREPPLPRVSLFVGLCRHFVRTHYLVPCWQRVPGVNIVRLCVSKDSFFLLPFYFQWIQNSRLKTCFHLSSGRFAPLSSSVRWSSWEREHRSPSSPLSAASPSLGALACCSGSPLVIDFEMLPLVPVHAVMPLTHWHHKWFQTPSTQAIGLLFNSL